MGDYWKYNGLGNDYLVIEPDAFDTALEADAARKICDRHTGVGADGILLGPLPAAGFPSAPEGAAGVRIINPDGSEAEKSGNGLRIFARHLWERGHVKEKSFSIATAGGTVRAELLDASGTMIAVEMGRVSFASGDIPMAGPAREVLGEALEVGGHNLRISGAGLGNPHCVVQVEAPTPELARELGPLIENHPAFPNRTNVQFMATEDEHRIRIEVWERGAGYTRSSGSSSCAAAAVACRLGLCSSPVTVVTQGGELLVTLDDAYHARLEAPVAAVGCGRFSDEFLSALGLRRREGPHDGDTRRPAGSGGEG
jgi:diaminopimelate epimerase